MARFTVGASLARILLAAGIAKEKAEEMADKFAGDYPDIEQFKGKFMEWVTANADGTLTPEHMMALVTIIVADFAAGHFTPDPKAFGGAV